MTRTLVLRTLSTLLAALMFLVMVADSADAQRRRRRRRRAPPQPTQQEEPPPPTEEPPVEDTAEPTAEGEGAPPPASDTGEDDENVAPTLPPAEPSAAPVAAFDPGPVGPDVTPIRTDFIALMDDLVQARNRVSALGSELFRTRMTLTLQDRTGDNTVLASIHVHVDGAPVFQSSTAVEGADDGREIFTGALAPGPHVVTLEVEQRSREDDAYRYTLRESFRFQVLRERLSETTLILEDSSDMASSFPSGGEGHYEVRTRFRVAARALPD